MALKTQGAGIFAGDNASPQVMSVIPGVRSISGPDGSAAEIDVTSLDSAAKEFLIGLADEGSVSLEILWDETANTNHAQLRTDRLAGDVRYYQIRLSDSPQTTYSFQAFVTGWSLGNAIDDATIANVTLRITGAVAKE